MSSPERILSLGLVLVLLLSTLGEGGASPGALALWHGGLAALVVAALVAPRRGGSGRVPDGIVLPFSVFLLCVLLGAARAPYSYAAWLVGLELACWVAVLGLAARFGAGILPRLTAALLAMAALEGGFAIAQWWGAPEQRPAGTFLNPNHAALWSVAVLLLATGAVRPSRRSRWLVAGGAALALATVVLTSSRGALLALLVGGGWWVAVRWRSVPRRWRAALAAGCLLLLVVLGLRQIDRGREFDPFRYHRFKIWRSSWIALAEEPLWGSGPGQFPTVAANLQFPDGEGPLRYDRKFTATHSDLLRLPVELGAPAAAALLCALFAAGKSIARRRRAGQLPAAADGAVAALLALGADALVDNPSSWPAVYLLSATFLGAILAVPSTAAPRFARGPRLTLAGVVLFLFLAGDLAPYFAWRDAAGLPAGRLSIEQQARLVRAVRLNPIQPHLRLRQAEELAADPSSWSLERYAAAREAAEHALRLSPAAEFERGVARIEARACRTLLPLAGCRERVREHYERAEAAAAKNPAIPAELAAFLLDTGDPTAARRAAERALALEPESVLPRLLLADGFIDLGSEDALRRAAELLEEAETQAARWAEWNRAAAAPLLALDPRTRERLHAKLDAARKALVR